MPSDLLRPDHSGAIAWPDAARQAAFDRWLAAVAPAHRLQLNTLRSVGLYFKA